MLEAVVYFKPGAVTNLIKESRLLKTALLFSDTVYTNHPELDSLIAVHGLDDSISTEHQYETILNAMPALNPTASVESMRENLLQIKNLKNNNRKSSREIIALKKAQKQLGQINNTFRIITETLFDSSSFSSIVSLLSKKVFFDYDTVTLNENSEYLYLLDEDLLKGYSQTSFATSIQKKKGIEDQRILTLPLLTEEDFDQFSIPSILKSQKIAKPALLSLLASLNITLQKKNLDIINAELEQFSVHAKDLPLKKVSKKLKTTDAASISLGICTYQLFEKIIKTTPLESPLIPTPQGFVPFIFNQTIKKNKSKATKQAVLQKN
ncbi:hypothetical protein [Aequorivita antarctica]|uniref:Uncharacterized protein n=1 Tax=Aequorivita antarctica TaxID=153266 RepID=A0A5C6YVV4_9FLAO|nr:hypothetical protein [Aequorivita antarctica]TXD71311.1 hypothetical protein ESU54_17305 [Aequorivita antarctica]SRX76200.1 hypothetical protein AEQU3_03199 [Aequorivita antarctica]